MNHPRIFGKMPFMQAKVQAGGPLRFLENFVCPFSLTPQIVDQVHYRVAKLVLFRFM
jgi:hypothetical protein